MDLSTYKKLINLKGVKVGEQYRNSSDYVMEETWDNDRDSQVAYIYDYYHDDQPDICVGMTYDNTTKTPINVKFQITTYGSLSKDQPEMHIMFKPSQKVVFDESDELYYVEEYRKKYWAEFPVGLYIDLADRKGVYHKYLICMKDVEAQFQKYFVLPVTFQLHWIQWLDGKRIKRRMWSVIRSQSSYNSGLWTDAVTTTRENQDKVWLPLNAISETLKYTNPDAKTNQRLIVDIPTKSPNVWQVSKVEHNHPYGLHKLTIYQHEFKPHTDYVDLETGEMFADYYIRDIEPVEEAVATSSTVVNLVSSTNTIKIGGSYKLIKASVVNGETDVSGNYSSAAHLWTCSIDGVDFTNSELVTWLEQDNKNNIKVKFGKDFDYTNKIIKISCSISGVIGDIELQLI